MKAALKRLLPSVVTNAIQAERAKLRLTRLLADWRSVVRDTANVASMRPIAKVLVVPPDPVSFLGSLGDSAMMTATAEEARKRNPGVEIVVVVGGAAAVETATLAGYKAADIWLERNYPAAVAALLRNDGIDAVVAIGADVMDGFYGAEVSMKLLMTVDIAARVGICAAVFGFSCNKAPDPALKSIFESVSKSVHFNLRDSLSLTNFRYFCDAPGSLVADCAFALSPGTLSEETQRWIGARRGLGRKIIGVNLHPMLFKNATDAQIASIVNGGITALKDVARQRNVSWVLIPHDYRPVIGDMVCLEPMFDALAPVLGDDIMLTTEARNAKAAKTIVAALDGVVCGRMHLAVASLGMGVPVLCVTYRGRTGGIVYAGKVQGLLGLFELPLSLCVEPDMFSTGSVGSSILLNFVDQMDHYREHLSVRLPEVKKLSALNFTVFD